MRNRDVALIAIKLLALWIIAGAAIQATELVLSWNTMRSQFASMNFGPNPPSPTSMVWSTLGAFLARAFVGVAVWLMGARLTRALFPADDPHYSTAESLVLLRAASFLVGLWLLADALPLAVLLHYQNREMIQDTPESPHSEGVAVLAISAEQGTEDLGYLPR